MKDIDLIEQTLRGNPHAFRFLVLRYERPVFKMVSTLLKEPLKVEEIAQETFLRAYRSLHSYDSHRGTAFSTWLFTIARNLCYNELKKNARSKEQSDSDIHTAVSNQDDAETTLTHTERARLVRRAIEKLPLSFRNAVVLSYINEHSTKEIAQIEGCSEGTVKSRIFRGKKLLAGYLKPLLGDW